MKNLIKLVEKLNKDYEGICDFRIVDRGDYINIYDNNEVYTIDYLEDLRCLMGTYIANDEIMDRIEEAVMLDFGEDAYPDWENNVVMYIYKNTNDGN